MKRVFIDGSAGTTGLRIRERLAARKDLEVGTLSDDVRKDPAARRAALNAADVDEVKANRTLDDYVKAFRQK